jgi:RimJ/RimL family protein N-acetyltransferase
MPGPEGRFDHRLGEEGDGKTHRPLFIFDAGAIAMSVFGSLHDALFPELFRDDVFRLETRRLWLRWPVAGDAAAFEEIATLDASTRERLAKRHPWLAGAPAGMIARARAANGFGSAAILVLAPKQFPGEAIGLAAIDAMSGAEPALLGMLGVPHQGYGLMTEAVRVLTGAVFMLTALERIEGSCAMTGIGARRVLEKSGFRVAARSTDSGGRHCPLTLTRKEWRAHWSAPSPRGGDEAADSYDNCAACG